MSKEFLRFKPPKLPLSIFLYFSSLVYLHIFVESSRSLFTNLLLAPGYERRLRLLSHRRFGRALSRAHFNASLIFDLISVKMIRALGRSRGGRRRRRLVRSASTPSILRSYLSSLSLSPSLSLSLSLSVSVSVSFHVADESSPRKNPFA